MDTISLPLNALSMRLLNVLDDAVIIIDNLAKVVFLNTTAENCTGWKQNEAQGEALDSVFPLQSTSEKQMLLQALWVVEEVGFDNDTLFIAPNGEVLRVRGKIVPLHHEAHGIQGRAMIFRTTPFGKSEPEQSIQALFETFTEPVFLIDQASTLRAANKAFMNRYGRGPLASIGSSLYTLLPSLVVETWKRSLKEVVVTSKPLSFEDHMEGRTDLHTITPLPYAEQRNRQFLVFSVDMTALGTRERAIWKSQEYYRNLLNRMMSDNDGQAVFMPEVEMANVKKNIEPENSEEARRTFDKKYQTLIAASPDSIITTNLENIITSISDIGLELYGTNNRTELIGVPFSKIVYSDDIKTINEIFKTTLYEGLIQNKEILLKKKNNSIYSAEISAALIQDEKGAPSAYMIIIRDISQRKIIESKLFHAKRLISLGEMASGIAHEIYQPINNIGLIIDKILSDASRNNCPCEKSIKIKSEKIFENILRVQTIIDNIRLFSRTDNNYIPSIVNVNKSIRNALIMISEQCKAKSITLTFKTRNEQLLVTGNIYRFEEVILNVIKNAIDAVEERVKLSAPGFAMHITINSYENNDSVIVIIDDNGIGIKPEVMDNIMNPFFSTKEEGKGTGLGLSISYGIIKEMNGTIRIESAPMKGTSIIITLPNKSKNEKL